MVGHQVVGNPFTPSRHDLLVVQDSHHVAVGVLDTYWLAWRSAATKAL